MRTVRCTLCNDTGRALADRVEKNGTRTTWCVACECPNGGQWVKLAQTAPRLPVG